MTSSRSCFSFCLCCCCCLFLLVVNNCWHCCCSCCCCKHCNTLRHMICWLAAMSKAKNHSSSLQRNQNEGAALRIRRVWPPAVRWSAKTKSSKQDSAEQKQSKANQIIYAASGPSIKLAWQPRLRSIGQTINGALMIYACLTAWLCVCVQHIYRYRCVWVS